MKILFIGDVFGRPGRKVVSRLLPALREETGAALVVANGENAASGVGITTETAAELFSAGVDVITGGNHIWDKREGISTIDRELRIVRPLNYPPGAPGRGIGIFPAGGTSVAVVSLMGRVFMQPFDCPFRALESALANLRDQAGVILVDMHAEATAEKMALAWYFDGRVTAIIGTHTHVQTADEQVFPRGTGYLTDAGMTGPHDSVIGVRKDLALKRLLTQMPVRYEPGEGDLRLHGALIECDPQSGRAVKVERIQRRWQP